MDQSGEDRESHRSRPPSEQLVDLHVYIIPEERWLRKRKLARNYVVDYAISAGFIRVLPTARLVDVRREINRQLGHDVVPKEYVFLRSVGRNFTQVKDFQEMDLKAKSFLPPCASEPEIYLKSGQFADQGWLHGDDSGLDEAYLDARRTHEIIERRIGVLTPPSLSSPDGFLPHLDSTRLFLSRPGKARRSAGNGAVAGGATTATTTYQWSNGGTAGAGPYQQHRVTTTTTTTTHRSTTTVEETSVRDQVHLLKLPAPPKDEKDLVEREGKPEEEEEESERQQQALDGQSEDRVHEEHTVGEADGPELSDAPPPASSVRRRPSVASSSPAAPVTGADAKDLAAQEVDDARAKDQSDNDVDDASAQRDQQREPSEATPSPAASVRDRRSRSDGAGTITLTLPSPTSGAAARTSLGSQRRPSLTESRRRSVATVPVVESSRLAVPTFQQQPRKLSFAGGSFGPRRGDEDSGGQRLKTRAQSEEALSQDFEGESERRPRRRPSREAESRRSSTAVSAEREETEQEADTKPEADAEAKAEVDAAEAARDRARGSSSAEGTSSDQEPRAGDRVQASRSREEVTKAASEAERDREEEEAKVEDGYGGREEAEPVGESRDYFREEGPYRLEVTEEEENEESAVAQATSDAPVGKVGDVIAAPSSQRTWKATGGGDRASRRIARLQKKLDTLREERLACEAKREDLLRRAKFLQSKATSTRDQARDMWRRRYAEEKKITPKLEEESARWRLELERLHRELLARVEGELRLTGYPRFEQPSNKLSYKIMIAKVLQEIEDLKRRLEYTRISLGAEVRLRTHAEREVKNLREDLLKKKIQVTLTKKETQSVMAPFLRDSFYFVGPI
ncbi:uncharacterized protein [Dermacentor andersoni]|uniref:uncharacterized protein isoform X2 n=1 Tax=Dermacentor andersoni TaxID=34620 RepID=UPI002155A14F|nr:uncharacterized protein LOC126539050 isoform X2 [Dermacentor andersoni]